MQKEFAKASPNVLNIADSMERTFAARQKWIAEECPSVADIFEAYPALSEVKEVFLEFQRITSVHLQELEALAERHMPTLLRLAGKKVEGVSLKLLAKAATVPDGGSVYMDPSYRLVFPSDQKYRSTFHLTTNARGSQLCNASKILPCLLKLRWFQKIRKTPWKRSSGKKRLRLACTFEVPVAHFI
ncbi:hypothetical protein HPB47_023965 [Ixodes persulcatus]|uniref:Uncharacterized protein n=1 Tax=Ixodes persulcatus TaxID=34615 RepID=A0AC60Q5V2_IXOPE|nr:hypothetical protein HPB47_023965 [Ixodes persulcatus]